MADNEWFKSWFDTKYYHILYKDRDESEADRFIKNIAGYLEIEPGSYVLDLACGSGRHAKKLCDLGFKVVGADLSENSISTAKKSKAENLEFIVHDMRQVISNYTFDYVFNMFTSFGYFEDKSDNDAVLQSIHTMLNSQGILILDFMNVEKVIDNLISEEKKQIDGLEFEIARSYDQSHITKDISFVDEGKRYHFQERVQALKLEDFEELMLRNGFNILRTFGNFDLEPFNASISDRLIIIAAKSE